MKYHQPSLTKKGLEVTNLAINFPLDLSKAKVGFERVLVKGHFNPNLFRVTLIYEGEEIVFWEVELTPGQIATLELHDNLSAYCKVVET